MKIGCIGQGFVGKHLSDDIEDRGYEVVRYALEKQYVENIEKLKDCDIVFVAVPAPTTPEGLDHSLLEDVIHLVRPGSTVVIKSTLLPGTTQKIQDIHKESIVLHSPELLSERTAAHDSSRPIMNVIGMAYDTAGHRRAAERVKSILPNADNNFIVPAEAAELYKYAHNLNGYFRIILTNLLFDFGTEAGADWADVKSMMDNDIMMSPYYNKPVHKEGRGAGGHCFIKDMAAFRHAYEQRLPNDNESIAVLKSLEGVNIKLLKSTGKSLDIIEGVYGKEATELLESDTEKKD